MSTPQHPINSGFTADSTIAEVLKGIDPRLTGIVGKLPVKSEEFRQMWGAS